MLRTSAGRPNTAAPLAFPLVLLACAAGHQAQPLKDGSWRVECEERIDRCLREAERTCEDEGYSIERGTRKNKVYGGEGGYQTAVDLHVLEFHCGQREAAPAARKSPPAAPPRKSTPPAKQLCIPGSTQACVGPAGCRGGQSCNTTGSGFLPCDCGPEPDAPSEASEPGEPLESGGPNQTPATSQ